MKRKVSLVEPVALGVIVVGLNVLLSLTVTMARPDDDYLKRREALLNSETDKFTGAKVKLTGKEKKVNEYLIELKRSELRKSHGNSSAFLPANNFLLAKEEIEKSQVFQFIRNIPKGASLHTHMLAGVSIDYVIKNISYMDNVYACYNELDIFKLKVLQNPKQDQNCTWRSLESYRKENQHFDYFLKDKLVLGKDAVGQTKEDVWMKFKNTFSCLYDLVAYRPVFKTYVYELLEELYRDNILYTELRGTFMPLYDLDGTTYDVKMFFDTFVKTVDKFKRTHPDFVGVKYIHSMYRGVDSDTLKEGLEQLIHYKSLYPDFIAGFDFVGSEEEGRDLVDFHVELSRASEQLKFFFHAGETLEYGRTDLNLADAILLNSTRIGHAYAISKHPKLLDAAKAKDIAIELCPLSNQVLKLNEDPRNHPATVLLSRGHPVVVCNDDPSAWQASGLSYDWYVVFMSMTWERHGLRVLKQLAQDSITYSAMNEMEKALAFSIWNQQWDRFIENTLGHISV